MIDCDELDWVSFAGVAMSNFRHVDRATGFLLPRSVDEWLPEHHPGTLCCGGDCSAGPFVDGEVLSRVWRCVLSPEPLLGLLVYGYATGVFSSRKLERATYDSVAFRFIAANDHPDHDTIATFRRRFLRQIEGLFVQSLLLAHEAGMLQLGTLALDGTKVHANASRHSALSYDYARKIEAQLKAREEKAEKTGRAPPTPGPGAKDQVNLTDQDSRIMPAACWWSPPMWSKPPTTNNRSSLALEQLGQLPDELGKAETLLADSGYFSQTNVEACAKAKITPWIAPGRERHHRSWKQRFVPAAAPNHPTALQAMIHRLATPGTGLRHHQIGHGLPTISPARPRSGQRRMEPGHPGLEHEADVRPAAYMTKRPATLSSP